MQYSVGGKIISKKPHACGGNQWSVTRIGADIKLKCDTCGKLLFVSVDQADRMKKNYISGERESNV